MKKLNLTISSDYGCLALVSVGRYGGFVSENWELAELIAHFLLQNKNGTLIPWGCVSGNWNVEIVIDGAVPDGCAQFESFIVSDGKILLTDYNSLTMAAQFNDVSLPEPHDDANVFDIAPGCYAVKIMRDFELEEAESEDIFSRISPHYYVCITKVENPCDELTEIPWFTCDMGP